MSAQKVKKGSPSWLRRVVPAGYQQATLTLTGTSPLLMHDNEYDRWGELYRSYYLLGQKRKKSLDDERRLGELEWQLALQLDEKAGPFVKGTAIKRLLRDAATKWRKGEEVKRSLVVVEYRIPVLYDGPRTQDELWAAGYRYETMIVNSGMNRGRVFRVRPKFDEWALVAELAYDPEELDFDFLGLVVERSKKYGLGDGRPEFGSFEALLEPGDVHKNMANGSALKPRDREQLKAHLAFVDRIMVGAAP